LKIKVYGHPKVTYKQRIKKWTYHRKGPEKGQKWYKARRWKKITRKLAYKEKYFTAKTGKEALQKVRKYYQKYKWIDFDVETP